VWDDEDWAPVATEPEPEPEPVARAAPAAADEPDPAPLDPDDIEVFEIVSSNRRRLARAGAR